MVNYLRNKKNRIRREAAKKVRLKGMCCELCGVTQEELKKKGKGLERHHFDYNLPTVVILACPSCHKNVLDKMEVRQPIAIKPFNKYILARRKKFEKKSDKLLLKDLVREKPSRVKYRRKIKGEKKRKIRNYNKEKVRLILYGDKTR